MRPRGRAAADCCSRARFTCYVPPARPARMVAALRTSHLQPRFDNPAPHPLTNITGPSLYSILTHFDTHKGEPFHRFLSDAAFVSQTHVTSFGHTVVIRQVLHESA